MSSASITTSTTSTSTSSTPSASPKLIHLELIFVSPSKNLTVPIARSETEEAKDILVIEDQLRLLVEQDEDLHKAVQEAKTIRVGRKVEFAFLGKN